MTENELFMMIHIRNILIVFFCAEREIPFQFNYSLNLERKLLDPCWIINIVKRIQHI